MSNRTFPTVGIAVRRLAMSASLVAFALLGGCGGGETEVRPPTVHYGQSECDVCRMIISDDRYAAGLVEIDARGRHVDRVFDDVGCLFEYEQREGRHDIAARYITDYETGEWLDLSEVRFVRSPQLISPMAFGLATVRDHERLESLRSQVDGEIIAPDQARQMFLKGELHISALEGQEEGLSLLVNVRTIALEDGRSLVIEMLTPQQIAPGKHPLEMRITSTGAPIGIDPAEFQVHIRPDMPSMGHGSPGNVDPIHTDEGVHSGEVNFTMAGHWVVHIRIAHGDRTLAETSFDFEVSR